MKSPRSISDEVRSFVLQEISDDLVSLILVRNHVQETLGVTDEHKCTEIVVGNIKRLLQEGLIEVGKLDFHTGEFVLWIDPIEEGADRIRHLLSLPSEELFCCEQGYLRRRTYPPAPNTPSDTPSSNSDSAE